MGVKIGKLEKKLKKYWLWKWTFGADKQEHLEEKTYIKIIFLMTFGKNN
jgi:hypothetical protein